MWQSISKKFKLPQINQVILTIILGEFILTTGSSLINPVFALFVVQNVAAPVTTIGFAVAIYWITKSILQLPLSKYLDKNHGEIDDHYFMLFGLTLVIVCIYLYYFVDAVWQIYALQFFIAVGDAFYVPPALAIFTRHLDKDKEAFEWALRSSFSSGAGSAIGGALSGILATTIGIRPIFIINGTFLLISLIVFIFLKPYLKQRVPQDISTFYEEKKI